MKGRSDISWTINNCQVVLQDGKKKIQVDFLEANEEFGDNKWLPRPANDTARLSGEYGCALEN